MRRVKTKKGVTLIEVILFLAITGAIFAMVMTGVSSSTSRRRYTDSVNDIVEQIRNAYSATINVENIRAKTEDSSYFCSISSAYSSTGALQINSKDTDNYPGRSRCAVYGQLITFGEQNNTRVNRYDIIGLAEVDARNNINPDDSDEVINSLRTIGANVVTIKQNNSAMTSCSVDLAGTTSSYLPQWDATIENTMGRALFKGAVMIARSPISGTVHTFVYTGSETFDVQNWLKTNAGSRNCSGFYNVNGQLVEKAMKNNQFEIRDLDMCVGSEDLIGVANRRRAIRIHADGSTESAVELLSEGDSLNVCKN